MTSLLTRIVRRLRHEVRRGSSAARRATVRVSRRVSGRWRRFSQQQQKRFASIEKRSKKPLKAWQKAYRLRAERVRHWKRRSSKATARHYKRGSRVVSRLIFKHLRVGRFLKWLRHLRRVVARHVGRVVRTLTYPLRRTYKITIRQPFTNRWKRVKHKYVDEVRGIHLKEKGRSYEDSFKGPGGKARYLRSQEDGKKRKREMFELYTRLAGPVPLDVPYVYVALHFQPERTTSSLGGIYGDQYLMVDMIARSIPVGWQVYVKEHPSQFYPPFGGERCRHAQFYHDLRRIPGVKLVSLNTSTFELTDRAQAVATVTGTVGWEAIIRGKPALIFGSSWYRYCEGVFFVQDESALQVALQRVQEGYRPDARKIRLFMHVLDELCARAALGYGTPDEQELDIDFDENVARLTAVVERLWDRMDAEPLAVRPPWRQLVHAEPDGTIVVDAAPAAPAEEVRLI